MALDVDQVRAVRMLRALEEMVEAYIVQRGGRREAGDMAAQLATPFRGAHDYRHRVPADDRSDAPLHRAIAGHAWLAVWRNGVDIGRGQVERQVGAGAARQFDQPVEQEMGALGTFPVDDGGKRLQPLARFFRVFVFRVGVLVYHESYPCLSFTDDVEFQL